MKKILLVIALSCTACSAFALEITSTAFKHTTEIPDAYTCTGSNTSPELTWAHAPAGTKTFVLICEDPDAPFGTWTHWIVYNIPENMTTLIENFALTNTETNIRQGINDFGEKTYGGPCPPPSNPHRYFFRLYALNCSLTLDKEPSRKDILQAIEGHILAETKIVGTYKR